MLFVAAVSLASCKSHSTASVASGPASSPASSPAGSTGGTASQTPAPGSNPLSSFCTQLQAERAKSAQLGKQFASAVTTPDLASIKKNFDAFFATEAQSIARVEATMTSAPADVQAALKVVNQFFLQLKSTIDNATSLQQFETSMRQYAHAKQLAAAGKVLANYTRSQCGTPASP
jgi:hypothetical protein